MRKSVLLTVVLIMLAFLVKAQNVTITPPSANIQPGESVTLTASGALYYTWSPADGLSTTEGPVTVASPLETTTYTCSGYSQGAESVINGNFDQGNYGFTSAYQYSYNLWNEGTYYVDSDASPHHESFYGLGHNGGNYMIINGSTSPGTNVWTEQITVIPNTYYAFSTWVCTLAGQANEVAQLQFSINGEQIGDIFSAPPERYVWEQFYELWYSGNTTTATITILNQNTVGSGNDFGLDDISFCALIVDEAQCTVSVGSLSVTATADAMELCSGESTTLHVLPVSGSGNYTFHWTPSGSLDNATAQHPVATPPVGSTTYTCHVVDLDWNSAQDVNVTLMVWPENDTLTFPRDICEGQTFTWFDGNQYDHDGDVAYYDTIGDHGCPQVYKLELLVGEYQTPINYNPNVYVCVPYDQDPYYHWEIADRYYTENAIDSIIVNDNVGGGCPLKYRLNLRFHKEYYRKDSIVECGEYYWPVTEQTYHESHIGNDTIVKTIPIPFGTETCDSTYVLKLVINEEITDPLPITIPGECDSTRVIPWEGHDPVYFHDDTPPEGYTFLGETAEGCYREQTVHVENMKYTPAPSKVQAVDPATVIYGWDWADADTAAVVTNTEFFSFQYSFFVKETNSKCVWDSCIWSISKPSWDIEFEAVPVLQNGMYYSECKVYVAEQDDDYVVLTAIVKNGCSSDTCKIYLKSSFLQIDENNSTSASVSIVPNPNNGQMALEVEGLTGMLDIKVYDMTGHLIDHVQTSNDDGNHSLPYDMKGRADGVYFFVVAGREGVVARKVIVSR